MYEKYQWTPRSNIADWIEHTFRENNKDADLLANEGVKSNGSEVLRILTRNFQGFSKALTRFPSDFHMCIQKFKKNIVYCFMFVSTLVFFSFKHIFWFQNVDADAFRPGQLRRY